MTDNAKEYITYDANLHFPEELKTNFSDVLDRVDKLLYDQERAGVYKDDVMWSVSGNVLSCTYYSQWDFPWVRNILEVIYNEFIAD